MAGKVREYNFIVGPETSELPAAGDPSETDDTVTLGYADANYMQGKASVADTTALAAIAAADRDNGMAVLSRATNTIYIFQSASVVAADGTRVVAPAAGSGRWVRHHAGEDAATGNFTVDGNLVVNGTTTTISTTNLEVEDANIIVNDGGTQATANSAIAGITVEMSDATHAKVGYDSSLASKFKCGNSGSESEIITAAQNQTMSGIKSFSAAPVVAEVSTPATPAAGYQKIYPKSDGKWYTLDDAGIEIQLGSGSGGGGINYIANPDAETDASGWTTYDDAAAVPVDGTGGTVTTTWTRSTSSPLRGTASFLLSKDASNRQGEGVGYAFTLPTADKSKQVQISFDFDATDSDYVDDDLQVFVLDVTNAAILYPSEYKVKKTMGTFQATVNLTNSTSYKLLLHYAGTNAAAVDIKIDNVQVGPVLAHMSLPFEAKNISTLVTFGAGFGTVTNKEIFLMRIGNYARIFGWFEAGTLAASAATLILPTGMSIDTTGMTSAKQRLGFWNRVVTGASSAFWNAGDAGALTYDANPGAGALQFSLNQSSDTYSNNAGNGLAAANSDTFSVDATFPVAQWAGAGANLSMAQPEYASNSNTTNANDTSSFDYGPSGNLIPNRSTGTAVSKDVRWRTPIQPTDMIVWQVWDGFCWFDGAQLYPSTIQGSVSYGMSFVSVDYQTTRVTFAAGGFRSTSGSYANNGQAWDVLYGSSYKWRVVKIPGNVQVASPTTVKWQKKQLATGTTSTGTISSLGFNNLLIGRTYRLTGKVQVSQVNSSPGGKQYNWKITHNAVSLVDSSQSSEATANDNTRLETNAGFDVIFVAAATTTVFTVVTNAASVSKLCGDDFAVACTFVQLEELSTHSQTTEWT